MKIVVEESAMSEDGLAKSAYRTHFVDLFGEAVPSSEMR